MIGGSYDSLGAAGCYSKAFEEKVKGNSEAADVYYRTARAYEKQIAALEKGDKKAAEWCRQMAKALNWYSQFFEEKTKGNKEAVDVCLKIVQLLETGLDRDQREDVEQYEEIIRILATAVHAYSLSFEKKAKGYSETANAYYRAAQACEKQVAALERGDEKDAGRYKQIAEALGKAGSDYHISHQYYDSKAGNDYYTYYHRSARAAEEEATALEREIEALSKKEKDTTSINTTANTESESNSSPASQQEKPKGSASEKKGNCTIS